MRVIFLIVGMVVGQTLFGQVNLVRNGGFEQYSQCPTGYDQIRYANFWTSIDTNWTLMNCAPEYCNSCATSLVGVPNGQCYHHYARSGSGFAETRLFVHVPSDSTFIERDYLQGQFIENLSDGKNYCITFYVILNQGSQYAINKIGAYIDDGSIDSGQNSNSCASPQTAFSPQIITSGNISDTLNWVKIQGRYTAIGNEKYITIGNFASQSEVDTISQLGVIWWCGESSYYSIDDVSVIEGSTVANAGTSQWVSPGSDSAFIGIPDEGLPTTWYIAGNPNPICYGTGGFKVHPDTTTSYVVTLDLCGNVTSDTVTVFVGRANVPIPSYLNKVNLYPNPTTHELHIDGATGCIIRLYDLVGRVVRILENAGIKQTLDMSTLPPGVYSLQVSDPVTGERLSRRVVKQ